MKHGKIWRFAFCLALLTVIVLTFGVTASLAEDNLNVSAHVGSGSGKIQINDRDPGVSDSYYYPKGTSVTITAIPEEGYRLAYWIGPAGWYYGDPGKTSVTFTVNSSNVSYTAHFISTSQAASAEMNNIDLGYASVGYTAYSGSTFYIKDNLNVKNTGSCYLYPYGFTLDEEGKKYFGITRTYNSGTAYIYPGQTTSNSYIVYPKNDLPAGVYTATVTMAEYCQSALAEPVKATVTFEVTEDPIITTNVSPSGSGTVNGGGRYSLGDNVVLTATPSEHYKFLRWSDNSTEPTCTFTAQEAATVTAYFEKYEYNVSASVHASYPGGKVQINERDLTPGSDSSYFEKGTEVTITAVPNDGYRLAYWIGPAGWYYGDPEKTSVTFTVNSSDVSYRACFISTSQAASAEMDNIDLGYASVGYTAYSGSTFYIKDNLNVKNTGSCSLYPYGFTLDEEGKKYFRITRTYNSGTAYISSGQTTSNNYIVYPKNDLPAGVYTATITMAERCQPALDTPLTAQVTFTVTPKYYIETSVSPEGAGTVEGAGEYDEGATVTLTASPIETYSFDYWERGGVSVATSDTYSFEADKAETVKAVFRRSKYNINVSVYNDEGGTVSLSGTSETSVNLTPGATITASASPATGYIFDYWTNNGTRTSDGAAVTLEAVADQTLVAHFALKDYTVTVNSGTGGSASANKTNVKMGETVTLTPSPQSGYEFVRWEAVTPYDLVITGNSFVMPAKDVTVNAVFVKVVTIPTAVEGLIYSGSEQTGVPAGTDYTITNNKATKIGTYTATLKLKDTVNSKWSDGTTSDKEIEWTIDFPGGADYMLEGKVTGTDLGYTITARYAGTQKLAAARYVDGQMVDVRMIEVALVAGENSDDDAFAGFCTGGNYKLFLLDATDLSPLCGN